MERKIGEIFEYNGEWYQCIVGNGCENCAFYGRKCYTFTDNGDPIGDCCADRRKDNKDVIFKKLKKVGEPYEKRVSDGTFSTFQRYKVYNSVILPKNPYMYCNFIDSTIEIEIKQSKEDMEENKTIFPKEDNALTRTVYAYVNGKISDKDLIRSIKEMSDEYPYDKNGLKPFSLESAKAGKPVCTRDGRKARIICFDRVGDFPIVALTDDREYKEEGVNLYDINGKGGNECFDLMMLPEKKEGWVNLRGSLSHNPHILDVVWDTKEEALDFRRKAPINAEIIATGKITWEE